MVTASAFLSAFVLSLLTFTFDNISKLPGLETWAVWMVVSRQVVDFEHRHPHSRDLSEQPSGPHLLRGRPPSPSIQR